MSDNAPVRPIGQAVLIYKPGCFISPGTIVENSHIYPDGKREYLVEPVGFTPKEYHSPLAARWYCFEYELREKE